MDPLRDASVPALVQVRTICHQIQAIVNEIGQLVATHPSPQDLAAQLQPFVFKVMALFTQLRESNRQCNHHQQELKHQTQSAKAEVDRLNQILQNLAYEKSHLQQEIQTYQQFESLSDTLTLQSIDDFQAKAPQELLDHDNEHTLYMNRLKFELQERRRLEEEKTKLVAAKQQLMKENHEHKQCLQVLSEQVSEFIKSSSKIKRALDKAAFRSDVPANTSNLAM
ncbi:hypothetical protein H4R34_004113 [Dimargaris verticillata]|uniref:Uncharacterized protein n=1 Tax=Dimargaris verticillata TaxID=2761393 RepID=A0A9W8EBF5_9FUNG|nr:hypothetical protein H4R34_004113 [Dimargaris verticillata]